MSKKNSKQKGFTLVELLIYIGILALVLVALSNMAFILQSSRVRFSINSDIHAAAARVLNTVGFLVRNSDGFVTDQNGNACFYTNKLWLYFATSSVNYLPPECSGDYASTAVSIESAGTTGAEQPGGYGIVSDGSYVYTAGPYFITKRRLSDLSYVQSWGSSGTITTSIDSRGLILDSGSLYITGRGTGGYFAIEKRFASSGSLDTSFDSDGYLESTGGQWANGSAVDGTYIYLFGDDTGGSGWRIEKRNKTTGALDSGFNGSGVITESNNAHYETGGISIDSTYMYLAGNYFYHTGGFPGVYHSGSTIEKRLLTTGVVDANWGSGAGYVTSTFSSSATAALVSGSYVYFAGYNAGYTWEISKNNISDGISVAGSPGGLTSVPLYMVSDGTYLYVSGENQGDTSELVVQKLQLSDLSLCDGTVGVCGSIDFGGNGNGRIMGTTPNDNGHSVYVIGSTLLVASDVTGTQRRLQTTGALIPNQDGVRLLCYQNYPNQGKNPNCDSIPLNSHTQALSLVDTTKVRILNGDLSFATTTIGSHQAIETTLNIGFDGKRLPTNFNIATYTTSSTAAFRITP